MNLESEQLRAAVLNARAAALNAEVAGMAAENAHRAACGDSVAYGVDAFLSAITNNRLGENNVILTAAHGVL